jgi:hypothetical protein
MRVHPKRLAQNIHRVYCVEDIISILKPRWKKWPL